jgi:DNA-binding transcriptional regulator YiaG
MKKKYQSEILGVLHEMADDLHKIGAINDTRMAEYDHDCLVQKTDQTYKEKTQIRPVTPAFAGQKH